MKTRFVPLDYWICVMDSTLDHTPTLVSGYAVGGETVLRLCVREHGRLWAVDHFDTGLSVWRGASRTEAVASAVSFLLKEQALGKLDAAINAAKKRSKVMSGLNVVPE